MLKCCCAWLNKGLVGWVAQRVSALAMLCYFLPIFYVWVTEPALSMQAWQHFLTSSWMIGLLGLQLFGFLVHAYLGLWTVCTDYIHAACCRALVLYGLAVYMVAAVVGFVMIVI